jgi:purine-binding chemotaxis protein CheW
LNGNGLEVVVFTLDGRRYGVPAADVQEVVRAVLPTPVPGAPDVVEGVINLRGHIVPVFDLRRRFRLPRRDVTPTDHLIVVRFAERRAVLRVDRVDGLVRLAAADVEEAGGVVPGAEYISWLARLPEELVLVHDLRTFLSRREAEVLDAALPPTGEEVRP